MRAKFINENLYENEIFYKLITKEDWTKIQNIKMILPIGKVISNQKEYFGNWAIPKSNIKSWLTKIKHFSSPLQALLMKKAPTNQSMVLIEFTIDENNKIYNRNITKMFINYSFSGYYGSFSEKEYYPITESFVLGEISNFKFINNFNVPTKIGEFMAEPESLLNFILGKGELLYTNKKMDSIKSTLFKVLLKKIFTFNFKNF